MGRPKLQHSRCLKIAPRVSEPEKLQIELAAEAKGVSVNAWCREAFSQLAEAEGIPLDSVLADLEFHRRLKNSQQKTA